MGSSAFGSGSPCLRVFGPALRVVNGAFLKRYSARIEQGQMLLRAQRRLTAQWIQK